MEETRDRHSRVRKFVPSVHERRVIEDRRREKQEAEEEKQKYKKLINEVEELKQELHDMIRNQKGE